MHLLRICFSGLGKSEGTRIDDRNHPGVMLTRFNESLSNCMKAGFDGQQNCQTTFFLAVTLNRRGNVSLLTAGMQGLSHKGAFVMCLTKNQPPLLL